MNVLMGRYKVTTKEVKDYFYGLYGRPSAPVNEEIRKKALKGYERGETPIDVRPGDVLEPENGIAAIGSGGAYAQSAALALLRNTDLAPAVIVKQSLEIAGDLCIYTNQQHLIETIE